MQHTTRHPLLLSLIAAATLVCSPLAQAERAAELDLPLLLIGASYAEGKTPFNNGIAPLGGTSVGLGSYLSLGQALTRENTLPGYVINEGEAGATTFARQACPPTASRCVAAGWNSYQTMLQRALARVAMPPAFSQYNARYVAIITANDCLHSGAIGVPQGQASQCTLADMNAVADRLIAVGQFAQSKGLTPIYDVLPAYTKLNLPLFQQLNGQVWVIGENDYNQLRNTVRSRIEAAMPDALVVDIWKDFKHIGDGIHPDPKTSRRAAELLAKAIRRHARVGDASD